VPPPDTRHINLPGFTISAVHLEFDGMCHTCVAPYPAS
jgi:hypothetical protein